MRKYVSVYNYGNILPLIKDAYCLSIRGSLFPPKYINVNTYKEVACYGYLALENARFGYGLATFAKNIFLPFPSNKLTRRVWSLYSLSSTPYSP